MRPAREDAKAPPTPQQCSHGATVSVAPTMDLCYDPHDIDASENRIPTAEQQPDINDLAADPPSQIASPNVPDRPLPEST